MLKTNLVGGVFARYLNALLSGGAASHPFKLTKLHTDTTIYIFPSNDRVTVIFTIGFNERVDVAVAKVFLQVLLVPINLLCRPFLTSPSLSLPLPLSCLSFFCASLYVGICRVSPSSW